MFLGALDRGEDLLTPWTFIGYHNSLDWVAFAMFVILVYPDHCGCAHKWALVPVIQGLAAHDLSFLYCVTLVFHLRIVMVA